MAVSVQLAGTRARSKHEFVELVKALAWPLVVLVIVLLFSNEIRSLLKEMPNVVRRLRSVEALGAKAELETLDSTSRELPAAEAQAKLLSLPIPQIPGSSHNDGGESDA